MKASSVVAECDHIAFFVWGLHNSCAYFWSCDDIGECPMLKVAIERAIEKSPHYDLAGNLSMWIMEYTNISLLDSFHPILGSMS